MSMTMHVDIVSAESSLFSGTAEMVFAPAIMGEVGVLPRHTPLLTQLKPGNVRVILAGGQEEHIYVSGGMLEIQPHVVTILSDTAIRAEDIDEEAAVAAKERAEAAMREQRDEIDYARAETELAEAIAQLKAVQDLRKKMKNR